MKKIIVLALLAAGMWSCSQPKEEVAAIVEPPAPQPIEFAEATYTDICKQSLAALTSKDVDAFVSSMADNIVYRFNNGDSIAGKPAVTAYWNDRFTNVVDNLSFSNDIWLSVEVNEPQQNEQSGNWVLGWYSVSATYKTGNVMNQGIHSVYHFDANSKIDEVIQYLDRAPINEAMMAKKK